jgi:8-oxo-dGTP pyrophosphatase MutT (NUDIX family)
MIFNQIIGIQSLDNTLVKVRYREAVRAVIIKDNKLLMVKLNTGEYKFPGGGVNSGESFETALVREVQEETGYIVSKIKDKAGIIIQRNYDEFGEEDIFEMCSSYYFCEVLDTQRQQNLDAYEAELEFQEEWVNIHKAIDCNELVLKGDKVNPWVQREALVLKLLKDYGVM